MLNCAIIGCGRIYSTHADVIMKNEHSTLAIVVDCVEERAARAAKRYACAHGRDYRQMLEDDSIDVVHICTPHHLHRPMAMEAMRKGKHVLLEKPIAITQEEAAELSGISAQTGRQLGVCFQNRYNEASSTAKKLLDSGKLGKVLGGRVFFTWTREAEYYNSEAWRGTWAQEGGGLLINQAIHTLDLMQWLGGEVEWLEASISTKHLQGVIEVEDTADAVLGTKGGAKFIFYATNGYIDDLEPLIELCCEKATLRLEDNLHIAYRDGRSETIVTSDQSHRPNAYWGLGHERLIRHFYQSIINREPFPIDAYQALKSLKIVRAFYSSSEKKKRVAV